MDSGFIVVQMKLIPATSLVSKFDPTLTWGKVCAEAKKVIGREAVAYKSVNSRFVPLLLTMPADNTRFKWCLGTCSFQTDYGEFELASVYFN